MLLRKTRELEQQRNDLSSKLQQATQNLHLKDEKIVGLIQQNSDQAIQMSAQQNKHTELLLVYQKIKEEQDNKKDFAKKKVAPFIFYSYKYDLDKKKFFYQNLLK